MSNIAGIRIWLIAAYDQLNSRIKVSVRSARWIINDTIAEFDGGGHQTAAGVYLQNIDEVEKLLANLNKVACKSPQLTTN